METKSLITLSMANKEGAALRTIEVISNSIAINSAANSLEKGNFGVILEHQNRESGDFLQELKVYLSFVDNTDDDADNSKSEIPIATIPASYFETGQFVKDSLFLKASL